MEKLEIIEGKSEDKVVNVTYNITVKDSAQVAVGDSASIVNYCTRDDCKDKKCFSIQDYTRKLKSSIKCQTDFQPGLRKYKTIKTDDIFTNLTIQHGLKHFKQDLPQAKESGYHTKTPSEDQAVQKSTLLKRCSEMFIFPQETLASTNPRSILTVGKPGIGKTLFCRKVVRDWAHGRLFLKNEEGIVSDFQICFPLTFRQLSLLGKEKMNLREILNCSSVLDKQSIIDEMVFQFLVENPDKLLIIFDGYDEYRHRDEIIGDFETKFPNDPCQRMPVPAMVAKLLKGKIFRESVVMVTSRPGQADRLLDEVDFETKVEILGYSSPQVLEYIRKYFHDNESIMTVVLEHIKSNPSLMAFAQIPIVCFLMCCLLEWHVTRSKTMENLPITITDLYQEVTKVFIKKHHAQLKYSKTTESDVQEILNKLAELAVNLQKEKKFIFDEEDIKKLNIGQEEIIDLTESGLLDCCPGIRKSPFDDVTLEYAFTHLTIQEFLVACWMIKEEEMPEKGGKTSDVTYQFMAGLLSKRRNEKLMGELLECVKPLNDLYDPKRVLTLKCLQEYGDKELAKRTISNLYDKYCNAHGVSVFYDLADVDCISVSFLLDIISLLSEDKEGDQPSTMSDNSAFRINAFGLINSFLTKTGMKQLCRSLPSLHFLAKLQFWNCEIDDDCVLIICDVLPELRITHLYLPSNQITDKGVEYISSVITASKEFPQFLNLGNNKLSDQCKDELRNLVEQRKPGTELILDRGRKRR